MSDGRIAVLGTGAWGTALAIAASRTGAAVTLWARDPALAATMAATRVNERYLPGHTLDAAIEVTSDPAATASAGLLLLAPPTQHLRALCRRIASLVPDATPIVACAKGIEHGSGDLPTQIIETELPGRPALALSGPTFAAEVAAGLPTAATVAGRDAALAREVAARLGSARFRLYHSDDPVGVQVGGALKNVVAIAAGTVEGRGLGENARAALVTRGLAEIGRLAAALGGRPTTTTGLAGLGDLMLTCSGRQSRNYTLGLALGQGRRLADVLSERHTVAEGVHTARAAVELAARLGVELPIGAAVEAVLHRDADIDRTIAELLARPFRAEDGGRDG